jgi:hypothetical protein
MSLGRRATISLLAARHFLSALRLYLRRITMLHRSSPQRPTIYHDTLAPNKCYKDTLQNSLISLIFI